MTEPPPVEPTPAGEPPPGPAPDSPLTRPRGRAARRAFNIALLLLPLGVLANLGYTLLATDRALLASLGELPRVYLLVALALTLTPWLTGSLRLMVWTRFLGHRLPFRELLRMTLVVDLGAAVSPTAIGGEAFRWGMLVRHGVRPGEAATVALLPKVEDAVFFFVFALPLAMIIARPWELPAIATSTRLLSSNALVVVGVGTGLALLAWLLLRSTLLGHAGARVQRGGVRWWGRTRRRLRAAWSDARAVLALILRRGKARFALTLLLTAAHWIGRYSVVMALALFLGVPFDPVLFWLLQWIVFTIMTFVPTPGATGGAEVAFTAVYATLLPAGVIGIATAAWRLFTFYVPVGLAALIFPLLARNEKGATHG
ncbi:MAG TPA: lysylphosphatidylglycerol synthase transmembrane domain-containing protein [Longimicrobiales bacterium]|nr:lysylphosphatidylglycerol synthase transmembrane domain-containing protein [Longimicrobiales bacterium]